MSSPKVIVPLAAGFEEIEAVTVIDVLRRAGVDVTVAGLAEGPVTGSHGITVATDRPLRACDPKEFAMIVLPGGMPGSAHLRDDETVRAFVRRMQAAGAFTAAICAAPIALSAAGATRGRTVTSYPGFRDQIEAGRYVEHRVVIDGKVITSRGPGTALEFALALVEHLAGAKKAAELENAMLVHRAEKPTTVSAP